MARLRIGASTSFQFPFSSFQPPFTKLHLLPKKAIRISNIKYQASFFFDMLAFMTELPKRIAQTQHAIDIRPRYAETDQGGVIHHSVFPVWLEMGRTELLRVNGLAYRDLEKAGVLFVVAELRIKFRRPAFYDTPLVLETTQSRVTASRVEHTYCLKQSETGQLLAEANSTLACVDRQGRLQRIPDFMSPEENSSSS